MTRGTLSNSVPALPKPSADDGGGLRAATRDIVLRSILAATCLLACVAGSVGDITGDVLFYAEGNLAESGDRFLTYRLRVIVTGADTWSVAGGLNVGDPWVVLEGATFYQHPLNDGNPPDLGSFPYFPDSAFTSFYTTHLGYPNVQAMGVAPDFAYGPADTATALNGYWYLTPDDNDYPGTYVIAQFTVLPDSPEWSGTINMDIGTREVGVVAFSWSIDDNDTPDCNENWTWDGWEIANGTSEDCNDNGIPDECELDCNGNGIHDYCDIADGTSEDCNGNFIPDECEPDCNDNGVADSCDIDVGTSEDCNENGVPDECDIADETSEDCNEDGIPDECGTDCNDNGVADSCDIDVGTSEDCNGNLVPDECDIADGASRDNNDNGVPDDCECPGDLSGDWQINLIDLSYVLMNYGVTSGAVYIDGDLDYDGDVDLADLAALLGYYGETCE